VVGDFRREPRGQPDPDRLRLDARGGDHHAQARPANLVHGVRQKSPTVRNPPYRIGHAVRAPRAEAPAGLSRLFPGVAGDLEDAEQ